jgi:hypothetical protein
MKRKKDMYEDDEDDEPGREKYALWEGFGVQISIRFSSTGRYWALLSYCHVTHCL